MPSMLAAPGQPIPHRPKHSSAPAVQSPPRVHFPSSTLVTGVSRPLTIDEAWHLYDFEKHARQCHYCHNPYKRYKSGTNLCAHGDGLAQRVAVLVYMSRGEVYERSSQRRKPARVEVPHTYTFLLEQLRVMEEVAKSAQPTPSRQHPENRNRIQIHTEIRQEREAPRRSERTEVVIETARSGDRRNGQERNREKYRHEPEHISEKEREREHREHRREYRAEEKRERTYRRTAEAEEAVNNRDKRYRTETRRPVWVENN